MLTPATPAMAQRKADLAQACNDAAHHWLQNVNTPTEMRLDGTRTAGGTVDLGTFVPKIRCGFPAKELRPDEFYVDVVDLLADP